MYRKLKVLFSSAMALVVIACGTPLPTAQDEAPRVEAVGQVGSYLQLPGLPGQGGEVGGALSGLLGGLKCQLSGTISVAVGPNGGTISLAGVTLTIPKGSLTQTKLIIMVPIPGNRPMVKFLPEGLVFAPNKRPTLSMSTACIGNPAHPVIVYMDDNGKILENKGGTKVGNTVQAQIDHFSRYAVDW